MLFKLAIFDWNGTTLNDVSLAYRAILMIFNRFDVAPPTFNQFRNGISRGVVKFSHKYGIPEDFTGDDFNALWSEFFLNGAGYCHEVTFQPDTLLFFQIIERMGLKTALVSSECPDVLARRLIQFELYDRFDCVRGAAWPKEDALREVIQKFGVEPQEAFYLDDTFEGICAAKSVGLQTIAYPNGYNDIRRILVAKPDFVLDSVGRMISIIRNGCPK